MFQKGACKEINNDKEVVFVVFSERPLECGECPRALRGYLFYAAKQETVELIASTHTIAELSIITTSGGSTTSILQELKIPIRCASCNLVLGSAVLKPSFGQCCIVYVCVFRIVQVFGRKPPLSK